MTEDPDRRARRGQEQPEYSFDKIPCLITLAVISTACFASIFFDADFFYPYGVGALFGFGLRGFFYERTAGARRGLSQRRNG